MGKGLIVTLIVFVVLIIGGYFIYTNYFGPEETQKTGVQDNEIGNIDLSECLSLQGENERVYSPRAFECWVNLAKENKNPTICEQGFKNQYMPDCYETVSKYFNDVSMCDGLEFAGTVEGLNPTSRKFNCYVEFANENNWDVCEDPYLVSYRTNDPLRPENSNSGSDFCYLTIVSRGNNLLGKFLTDDEIISLCGKIVDEDLGSSCLNYVGDPFNIPQEIKDKYPGLYS